MRWLLVLCVVVPQWAHGSPPGTLAAQVQSATITDSARAKVLAHLARGELAEAIHAYEVATGLKAPLWLIGFKAAFDASKQVPGACQGVARSVHTVFTQLGGKPEYVRLLALAVFWVPTAFTWFGARSGIDGRPAATACAA